VRGPDHFFSYGHPNTSRLLNGWGNTRAANQGSQLRASLWGSSGSTDSKDGSAHPRWREMLLHVCERWCGFRTKATPRRSKIADAVGFSDCTAQTLLVYWRALPSTKVRQPSVFHDASRMVFPKEWVWRFRTGFFMTPGQASRSANRSGLSLFIVNGIPPIAANHFRHASACVGGYSGEGMAAPPP
jgi:hypothetical protein